MSTTYGARRVSLTDIIDQIAWMDVLAVSGGRSRPAYAPDASPVTSHPIGLEFPCGNGYRVRVLLADDDTYTVQRVFARAGREWVKGEATRVYCSELSETFYRAGCFRDSWPAGGIA